MVRDHSVRLFEIALLTARFSGRLVCPFHRRHMSLVNAGHRRISSSTCFVLICSYQLSATADPSVYDTAGVNADSLDKLVQLYNETPTALLDVHAPVVSRTARLRPRTNPWFDNHCRETKKRARKLERRYTRATVLTVVGANGPTPFVILINLATLLTQPNLFGRHQ